MIPNQGTQEQVKAFDLFVITYTHGKNLDICFKKDSYFGKKISDDIFDSAKLTVVEMLKTVSKDFLTDQMWLEQSEWV